MERNMLGIGGRKNYELGGGEVRLESIWLYK